MMDKGKQNKIKGVPVLTVHTRDSEDIHEAFTNNQAIKMDILYDTLDRMMDKIDGDSKLKQHDCKELANPKQVKAPISYEKENAAEGGLYLGEKDSEVKVQSKLEITCKVYGRDCTALAAWKNQASNKEKMDKFEVECRKVEMNYDIVRKQLADFDDAREVGTKELKCWQSEPATVIESRREKGYKDDDCPLTERTKCNNWGKWITSLMDPDLEGKEQCSGKNQPIGDKSYRFCRVEKCLFMEIKTLLWDSSTARCNKKQKNTEVDGEYRWKDCL